MKSVQLGSGPYYLDKIEPIGDWWAGNHGSMLCPVAWSSDNEMTIETDKNGVIEVGKSVRCGSIVSRRFGDEDWWQTSLVTEILEVNEANTYCKFKTMNSVYEARSEGGIV